MIVEKTGKILAIFLFISFFFLVFLAGVVRALREDNLDRNYFKTETIPSYRGAIVSSDWRTLAQSDRRFNVAFDGRDAENKPLIAKLVAIFANKSEAEIMELLNRETRVYLVKDLNALDAKNMQYLSAELDRKGAFKTFIINSNAVRRGLEIAPAEPPQTRLYEYGSLAQPVIGYVQKSNGEGQMGLERFYEARLKPISEGAFRAPRDALGNMIYNDRLQYTPSKNGFGLQLTIDSFLQFDLERLLDKAQLEYDAAEILCAVMESETGRLIALAASARYDAENITSETLPNARIGAVQYLFEPGSVMKPFIVALLFEEGIAGQFDLVRGYNGRWTLGRDVITDTTPREWFSVEDVIVYSSNIGAAQLAMRLSEYKLFDGLSAFGFSRPTGVDLPYESLGSLAGLHRYRADIYRATTGYGYGLRVTFMQMLKAYNAFNNGGVMVSPRLVDRLLGEGAPPLDFEPSARVVSEATAMKILQILRKTVLRGAAKSAAIDGAFIAGKTGTARIASGGGYKNDYHNSFFGFANDGERRYAIGVLVIDPKKSRSASQSAAPIFADTARLLIRHNRLTIK
ncbi:MAG: penicillin-binding protein 2 [Helicobacteraceae bacterium]|nr:penicillin-binding protein 2 [Helicobacteraceae bacterium]